MRGLLVTDVLGAVRVSQRARRLVVVVVGRRQTGDHQRLGVAAERVLQETGQLGVAVRDVGRPAVDQRRDDVAQCRQRHVDLGRFLRRSHTHDERPAFTARVHGRSIHHAHVHEP